MAVKPITLRLPEDVYRGVQMLAQEAGSTINAVIAESLQERLRKREEEALWQSFTLLGSNEEESDVDFAFDAQSEVALGGD
jgi:hypothetical protein